MLEKFTANIKSAALILTGHIQITKKLYEKSLGLLLKANVELQKIVDL
jgi:hypothetical protein